MWSTLCSKCYSQLIKCEPKSITEPCPVNLTYLECSQYSPVVLPAGPRRKLLEFHSYLSLEDFILTFSMYKCLLLLDLLALPLLKPHPSRGDFPLTFWLICYNVNDRVYCYTNIIEPFFFLKSVLPNVFWDILSTCLFGFVNKTSRTVLHTCVNVWEVSLLWSRRSLSRSFAKVIGAAPAHSRICRSPMVLSIQQKVGMVFFVWIWILSVGCGAWES